jgi:hypothetical protein
MLSTWMRIEVKAVNGEDTHVCDLTLQGPKNEAMELIESLLKKEFERPNLPDQPSLDKTGRIHPRD